ncbi:unnamed protein product [Prunus armeniaca]
MVWKNVQIKFQLIKDNIKGWLVSTPGKCLMFLKHGHVKVVGYTDSDWAGKRDKRRSTSGYFSSEVEFRAVMKGVCELLWLKRLMEELGFPSKDTMKLYCHNQSSIKIAEDLVQHDRTKHVEINRNFIYEKLEEKIIEVPYVRTTEQLTDMLTKAVSNQAFTDSLVKLGICNIYAPF